MEWRRYRPRQTSTQAGRSSKSICNLSADSIKVEQFNPPKTFVIKKADIRHAYLVLEMEELF